MQPGNPRVSYSFALKSTYQPDQPTRSHPLKLNCPSNTNPFITTHSLLQIQTMTTRSPTARTRRRQRRPSRPEQPQGHPARGGVFHPLPLGPPCGVGTTTIFEREGPEVHVVRVLLLAQFRTISQSGTISNYFYGIGPITSTSWSLYCSPPEKEKRETRESPIFTIAVNIHN